MRVGTKKIFITFLIIFVLNNVSQAESLFRGGVYASDFVAPRSLYYSVKAKNIGDVVTVVIDEATKVQDDVKLDTSKSSQLQDGFSGLINKLLPGNTVINDKFNGYGGSSSVANAAKTNRTTAYSTTVAAQVVQILPNGNLVIQGRKTLMNSGEKTDLLMSGVIDPRLINSTGSINSSQVANLQFAVSGKGTISRSNNEGFINKYIKYLF